MTVLGIESSCDECSLALVQDGKKILSQVIATQISHHEKYQGVVPELASRLHTEWILPVYRECLENSGVEPESIDGIAVTNRPGLTGSLLVGLSFAKGLALGWNKPLVGVDHILAHLYAPQLEFDIPYPFLGLLVSGGHSLVVLARDVDDMEVLGTTIDDAVGEAFDKVAKHLGLGYPGGKYIDQLAQKGNPEAYLFPKPNFHGKGSSMDVSYSGLKTAVAHQRERFRNPKVSEAGLPDLAASFQKTAVDILLAKLKKAVKATGIKTVVAGGGVAANSYLRRSLEEWKGVKTYYPRLDLCGDNGAMIAGLGYHLLRRGEDHGLHLMVESRVVRPRSPLPL